MRFYKILITDADTDQEYLTFSSVTKDGKNDPGALNIELAMPVAGYATPFGPAQTFLRIWGPSLKQVGQQTQLVGKKISISGGMGKGLPLATRQSAQQGLLVSGVIYQAFANWIGVNMTLDITMQADNEYRQSSRNFSVLWKANTPLSDAIRTTLQTAYPGYDLKINISDRLTVNYDQPGYYNSLPQLAQWIKDRSLSIILDDTYQGVDIVIREKTIFVFDGSTKTTPIELNYSDLVGQPTWIPGEQAGSGGGGFALQITTVMRGDLTVNDFVKLPPGALTTTNAQQIGSSEFVSFQGSYRIAQIQHVGNFRQPDGQAWVTVFDTYPQI